MAIRLGVNRNGRDSHLAQSANHTAGNGTAIRNENFAEHHYSAAQINTSTGVGLYALHGLFNWGQLLISASTSVSARISTYLPGSEIPSSNVSLPSGVTGTFIKKLMLLVMSRLSHPCPFSMRAFRKLLRQACMCRFAMAYRTMLLSSAQAPPSVSWRPHVSATIVSSTVPVPVRRRVPVVR